MLGGNFNCFVRVKDNIMDIEMVMGCNLVFEVLCVKIFVIVFYIV